MQLKPLLNQPVASVSRTWLGFSVSTKQKPSELGAVQQLFRELNSL